MPCDEAILKTGPKQIIEPTSRQDSLRILGEAGIAAAMEAILAFMDAYYLAASPLSRTRARSPRPAASI